MSISLAEHQRPHEILIIVSGETSMQEMMDFIVTSRNSSQRDCAFLFDVSDSIVNLSGDDMRQLAAYAAQESRKSPLGPVAFISTNPGAFGISRMYQSYSVAEGRNNVGVFHTVSDAREWLATLNRQG